MNVLRGESVSPGIAVGPVHLRGYDDDEIGVSRIAADQVEAELERLRAAVGQSRAQIEEIRGKQQGQLGEAELRIFDAQIAYLGDPSFVAEIELQVVQERLAVRAAVKTVYAKYDRIFQLVENEILRRRASDLRDVATRVLRNLASGEPSARKAPAGRYVLAARKLTTADMFNLDAEGVDAIVAEEGGMSSHAAILARGMGIPTLTGIRGLPRLLRDGSVVVVDSDHGELRVDLTEAELGQYAERSQTWKSLQKQAPETEALHETRDGTAVELLGSCGSLGEAEMSRTFGLAGIGVFRTELAFLADKRLPTEDELVAQYQKVIEGHPGQPVNFRLLDVAAGVFAPGAKDPERNPAMGRRGVRGLLANQDILRLQLRAILRAAAGTENVGVLVPFVTSVMDLQRVKAILIEERLALRKAKVAVAGSLALAPILEVPVAAFSIGALAVESDFLVLAIDDLQAYLLAADRDNSAVREYHELAHPAVFEFLARIAKEADRLEKDVVLFGESAADPQRMPFYIGAGFRRFSIAPVRLRKLLKVLRRYSADECRRIAARVLEAPRAVDVQRVLVNVETD
jgi:phosphotransferase system enzyme I (PtsI)